MNSKMSFLFLFSVCLAGLSSPAMAREGGVQGGGGDASERRVDEIRADILKWINEGGGRGLVLPADLTYESYLIGMERVLTPQAVVVGFVSTPQESATHDRELKVVVDNQPKTCRGFESKKDRRLHILCNIERFTSTNESEQYRLIHHEYAGLVGLEQNIGASSDYTISSQITDFLVPEKVLRLSIKKRDSQQASEPAPIRYPQFQGNLFFAAEHSALDGDSEKCKARQTQERAERVCRFYGYDGVRDFKVERSDSRDLQIVASYDSAKSTYLISGRFKKSEMKLKDSDCTSAGKMIGNLIGTVFLVKTVQVFTTDDRDDAFSEVACYNNTVR